MGATIEARPLRAEEYRASSLRTPLTLRRGHLRLSVETDGSVRFLESLKENRLLFGREQVLFYKTKAGVLVQSQRPDWNVRVTPFEVSFSARVLDAMEVSQRIRLLPRPVEGCVRFLSLKNSSQAPVKARVISAQDPTAAHFREINSGWGTLAVNAFNRSSHIAMDEIIDLPAARIVGSRPKPKLFYMSTERGKISELLKDGELPEPTAGMSGQVLVLAQHDLEIPAGGGSDVAMLSIYDSAKLEGALSSFDSLSTAHEIAEPELFEVASSSQSVATSAAWALSALEGVQYENDALDRYEVLRALPYVDPDAAKSILERAKAAVGRDGSIGHSLDPSRPGLLETSALMEGACLIGLLSCDRKHARALYPTVKKLAGFLVATSAGGIVKTDASLPQSWRRRIGKGYPTGEIPEVSLSLASALSRAAFLASRLGKEEESARWEERSKVTVEAVRKRNLDERGLLALCLDGERLRSEETIDQAMACYRHPLNDVVDSHGIRRLLEKDFESGWGPRTVPTSNRIYFNPSYGEGQLGGYWTRAALAHAVAAYSAGLAGIGSVELESISKLPLAEAVKLGGRPGDFPYWVDLHKRESHGQGSDPVAAARYLEALVRGELGLEVNSVGLAFNPSPSSRLRWLLVSGIYLGKRTSVFLGRAEGRAYTFAGLPDCRTSSGWNFSGAEAAQADDGRISAASFFTPGQTVCVGNKSESAVRTRISFKPRDPALSKHLSAGLLQFDSSSGAWAKVSSIRVLSPMSFEAALGPSKWAAFRISTGS